MRKAACTALIDRTISSGVMLVQDYDQLDTEAALQLVRRAHRSAFWFALLGASATELEAGVTCRA